MSKPVYVNGTEIFEKYKARLLDYKVDSPSITDSYLEMKHSIVPVKLKESVGTRKITLELEFKGDTCNDSLMNISDLTAEFLQETELQLPDGFDYFCVLNKAAAPVLEGDTFYSVKFTLVGYRHLPVESKVFTETDSLEASGNVEAPVIITIEDAYGTVTVNDITVKNIDGTVVINGYDKTVMALTDGVFVNKFKDCTMTKFPTVKPGFNLISITGSATVTIEYTPVLL